MKRSCWIALLVLFHTFYACAQEPPYCHTVTAANLSVHQIPEFQQVSGLPALPPDIGYLWRRFYDVKLLDENGADIDGTGLGACNPVTVSINPSGSGTAVFPGGAPDGSNSTSFALLSSSTLAVFGSAFSGSANDLSISVSGAPNAPAPINFTVVAVDFSSSAASGTTSPDDVDPPANLCAFENGAVCKPGQGATLGRVHLYPEAGFIPLCAIGFEERIRVLPSNYGGDIFSFRYSRQKRTYFGNQVSETDNTNDISSPDNQSQSRSALGFNYDVDAPSSLFEPMGTQSMQVFRKRENFGTQAAFGNITAIYDLAGQATLTQAQAYVNEVLLDQPFNFFVRLSCTISQAGQWDFVDDVPGDNTAGLNCTPLAADLTGSCQ